MGQSGMVVFGKFCIKRGREAHKRCTAFCRVHRAFKNMSDISCRLLRLNFLHFLPILLYSSYCSNRPNN